MDPTRGSSGSPSRTPVSYVVLIVAVVLVFGAVGFQWVKGRQSHTSSQVASAVTPNAEGTGPATPLSTAAILGTGDLGRLFPAQFQARQVDGNAASHYWALLIGISRYSSPTVEIPGSVPDASALRSVLLSEGWLPDHMLLLTDRVATAAHIVESIRWLAGKTDRNSTAVFHYAGHEKPIFGNVDHDGEQRNVALWSTENRLISDGQLGRELAGVHAARMWIDLSTCRAQGFDDRGTLGPGRVVTYASEESELSNDAIDLGHSIFGYYMIVQGMAAKNADGNHDGDVTVEEAFAYARPQVISDTEDTQHPVLIDDVTSGSFSLRVSP